MRSPSDELRRALLDERARALAVVLGREEVIEYLKTLWLGPDTAAARPIVQQ